QRLLFISDESGWWNPSLWSADEGARQGLVAEEEFAGPMWQLGETSFQVLDADHALVRHVRAATSLSVLAAGIGQRTGRDCPSALVSSAQVRADGEVVLAGACPTRCAAIHLARLDREGPSAPVLGEPVQLRSSREHAPGPAVLPTAESIEVSLPD